MANSSPAVLGNNTRIVINSTILSTDFNQVKLSFSQAVHDVTTFGTTAWKEFIGGIGEATFNLVGFFNNAANKSHAIIWAMFGGPSSSTSWEIDLPNSSVGSTRYSGQCYAKTYAPEGGVGAPWKITADFQVTGAPVSATIAS